jgi:hypothetical protein
MTLYRLYQQNGNRTGFWVQHRTWVNTCGRVVSIGGDGAAVVMELFDIRSGRALAHADERRTQPLAEDEPDYVPMPPPSSSSSMTPTETPARDAFDRQYASIAEPFWHTNGRTPA